MRIKSEDGAIGPPQNPLRRLGLAEIAGAEKK
jgi:hypothetical protein